MENLLVSHFDGHNLTLPQLHRAAERILPLLADPRCSLTDIAEQLATDQVVAAAVLRMANSPLYRGLDKITSLQPAVGRLGIRAVRTLLLHESLRGAMFSGEGMLSDFADVLWRRSLAGGAIMRRLAQLTSADPDDAFLIGLLHDIGYVVVLRIVSGDRNASRYEIAPETLEYLCSESHQEFGELIAVKWGLPPALRALISDHHSDPSTDDPLRRDRLRLQLTDMITSLLGYSPWAPYDLWHCKVVQELGLSDRRNFRELLESLPDELDEAVAAL